MAPKLYMTITSPPVRSVLMVAANLKVDLEQIEVSIMAKEHLTPEYKKKNPQHTVPMLEDGDFTIGESHAIIAYLANVYSKDDSLYPKDFKKRATVDQLLHFDSNTLFARFKNAVRPVLYHGETEIPQAKIDDINEAYGIAEGFLSKNSWMAADHYTLADFSCITSMGGLDTLVPLDAGKFPKVAAWMKKCYSLPFYADLCAPGEDKLRQIVEDKMDRT